ncbi:MAG: hypothetical protein GF355_05865 [Candidatus Eisenbacteria bacterium]|nr:hypothetical protein [Candidatus Eisenbacteria bacterium]
MENCWEFRGCGLEPGGRHADDLGVCPVALETQSHGVNRGLAAGRLCWTVEGKLSPGPLKTKMEKCRTCSFYKKVAREEGDRFIRRRCSRVNHQEGDSPAE